MVKKSGVQRNPQRLLLGLIGSGIQASRSPIMHECEAAEHGVKCLYQIIDLDQLNLTVDALPELLSSAEHMGFAGLNITHPCKQAVLPFLTDLSDDARALGAVNTVVLHDGRRWGHNTDWLGFSQSFLRGLPGAPMGRVVQLGAGGAGAATAYAMLKMGVGHIAVVDPDPGRNSALVDRLGSIFGSERIGISTSLAASLASADGLIHATPTGMLGYPGLPLSAELLRHNLWVAEIVYFPLDTALLQAARAASCRTLDGSWMAVHQAAEAFQIFSGKPADAERMHHYFINMVPTQ